MSQFDLYDKTGNMSRAQIAAEIADYQKAMCRKLTFNKPLRIVVIGASIMNGTFSSSTNRSIFKSSLEKDGIAVLDVAEYAINGHKSADTLAVIPTLMSDYTGFEDQTLVIMHTGGNDISANGPYPGGADTLNTNYRRIINDLQNAGFTVLPASITYRVPPASNPSAPYNELVILPAITELTPHALSLSGRPVLDLYRFSMTHEGIHSDGVHYTTDGYKEMVKYIASRLPVVLDTANAYNQTLTDVIIDVGNTTSSSPLFSKIAAGVNGDKAIYLTNILDADGRRLSDLTITALGFSGEYSSGVDYGGSGYVLNNPAITLDSCYVAHPRFPGYKGNIGTISFSGTSIDDDALYDVTIVANRPSTSSDLRWGTYVCNGVSKDMNADTDDSPGVLPSITFNAVSGSALKASGISVMRRATDDNRDTFAYLCGFRITKQD